MKTHTRRGSPKLNFARQIAFVGLLAMPFTATASESASGFTYSIDPNVSMEQKAAYNVVHQYESDLNTANTHGILDLFAPQSVAEWNNKVTYTTAEQKKDGYDALFKRAKFKTVFGFASIDIYGDTAVVRTFHHKGAAVLENGHEVTDLNREVFILNKINGTYKIVFYMFNTDPAQGEG